MSVVADTISTPRLRPSVWLWLGYILLAGVLVRLAIAPHYGFRSDISTFRTWATRLVNTPLSRFYNGGTGGGLGQVSAPVAGRGFNNTVDHLPGDLWFLWAIAHLYHHFSPAMNVTRPAFMVLLKLVPTLADTCIAFLSFLIARRLSGDRAGLVAATLIALNPASIFLTAVWGQWDAVSVAFVMLALWLVVRGQPTWALPALTWASLIKPQFALLIPLVLVIWWRWSMQPATTRARLRAVLQLAAAGLTSLALLLALDLPFGVGLPGMSTQWTLWGRAKIALDRFNAATVNAFNLWGIVAHGNRAVVDSQTLFPGLSYQRAGMLLLGGVLLLVLALVWRRPTAEMVVWAALALSCALFLFPTRIHERYLLPAVMLAALVAALAPRLWWLAAGLTATCLTNLVAVYRLSGTGGLGQFNQIVLPDAHLAFVVSAANLFLMLMVLAAGVELERRQDVPAAATSGYARPVTLALPSVAGGER